MSTISLINATNSLIKIESTVSPDLGRSYWQLINSLAPSTSPSINILEFNRNSGITKGKTWIFTSSFLFDGIEILLQEQVTGTFFGSTIKQCITAGSVTTGFLDTNDSKSITFFGKSGEKYELSWQIHVPFGSFYANIEYAIEVIEAKYIHIPPVMPQIETIVFLMLENRSLDNLLGMLYADSSPKSVYPLGSPLKFDGVPLDAKNYYHQTAYSPSNGCDSLSAPQFDPGEEFNHIQNDLYADGLGKLPSGLFWNTTPTMSGFVWDFDEIWTKNQQIMGTYNKEQLPVLYGLAENYAISDRWFCSVPTQTYANRAFSLCGTSLGKVDNSEIDGTTYADTNTIFNVLGDAGKTWGVYWVTDGGIAAGSPSGDPFTPYFFPRLNADSHGSIHEFNNTNQTDAFIQSLAAGTLPNFCFVEPAWGGGFLDIAIQGTDFHPPTNVGPCDAALNTLFNALKASPQWQKMLLVITFDENGGTYDHVPPTLTVAPDAAPLAPSTQANGFAFQRLGVRVPTLLVSPFIEEGLVFRSPEPNKDFDHTSFIATFCKWAGIEPSSAGLGARVAQAPTFEGIFRLADARTIHPVLTANEASLIDNNPLNNPAPLGADGKEMKAKPLNFGDLHAIAGVSKSREDFIKRLQAKRYPEK